MNDESGLTARPKNYLIESILVTLLCFLPFGIVGVIKAVKVNSLFDAGDVQGALEASKSAWKWTKIAFFTGIGLTVLVFLLGVVGFLLMDVMSGPTR